MSNSVLMGVGGSWQWVVEVWVGGGTGAVQVTSAIVQFNFAALSNCGGNCGTTTNEPGA